MGRVTFEATPPHELMSGVRPHEIHDERTARRLADSGRPRILFLSHRFPFPAVGGDRVKAFHLLQHLADVAEVDLIALDEAQTATAETIGVIEQYAHTTVVPFDKRKGMARVAGAFFGSTPIEFAYYNEPAMQRAVDKALASKKYDLIICFFLRTAGYVANHTATKKLLIAEDARVILQERASERFSASPEWLVRSIDARRLHDYEPNMMSRGFARVTFVSKVDEARIKRAAPELPTAILSNGVELSQYEFYAGERQDSVLFVGDLTVYHNILMARRLLKSIYPVIREVSPRTKLVIVGKSPGVELEQLVAATAGAELHANVPDVRPYLRAARAFLHPQSVGAGIQNKLLEAMASGVAVVTTPVGASGIEGVEDNVHALVRTTDTDLIEATLSLLKNDDRSMRLATNARQLVEAQYSWQHVYDALDAILHEVAPEVFTAAKETAAVV